MCNIWQAKAKQNKETQPSNLNINFNFGRLKKLKWNLPNWEEIISGNVLIEHVSMDLRYNYTKPKLYESF